MIFLRMLTALFLLSGLILAQTVYTENDVQICKSKFRIAVDKNLTDKSLNEVIVEIGKSFLGLDYEASTLDKSIDEKLVIHLSGLDCYTFLENSFVLARCIKQGKTSFEDYQKELQNIRYRNGILKGYISRLHYFTDWIFDCSTRGIVKDITKEIGGEPYNKPVNFMSTHPASYKQLKDNPALVKEIEAIEKEMAERKHYYIPEEKLSGIESKIQSGDLIAITTNIEGLDVSHVGIAVKMDDGRIHLMHSPNAGKKIQITEQPLIDYLLANKRQTGVMVVRANSQ
jgi:hypothetical protein